MPIDIAQGGLQNIQPGATGSPSMGREGFLAFNPGWIDYARAGKVFGAQTAATGVAPGTALGTTGPFTLMNPPGSAKVLIVLAVSMGYISGTLGAGHVVAALGRPSDAIATGTAITAVNVFTGARGGTGAQPLTTSTIVTPVGVLDLFNLDASLATTAGIGGLVLVAKLDGLLVIGPGVPMTLQGIAAAGAAPLVTFSVVWAELDA